MANLWTTQECGMGKDWPIRCSGEIVAIAQDGETARRICAAVNGRAALVAACKMAIGFAVAFRQDVPDWERFPDVGVLFARMTEALKIAESV